MRDKTTVHERGPGDRLVMTGTVLFVVGALATLVTIAPLLLGTDPFPTVAYAVCMLMAVGFVTAAAGLLYGVAAQRKSAARARESLRAEEGLRAGGAEG